MAPTRLSPAEADCFASLALDCLHREYPNKIAHVLNSAEDVKPPRELTPAFYGCYDWHSAVHNHWVLVRLTRLFPQASFASAATQALNERLTPANIAQEVRYLETPGRESFERPYGLSWLLQLCAELKEWRSPEAHRWSAACAPLESSVIARLSAWLPKLSHPVRTGEHTNTAFALGLMLDYARAASQTEFLRLLEESSARFYLDDTNCPIGYEPSGEDFLSPCLAEADLGRRIMPTQEFAAWLSNFIPRFDLEPSEIIDETDGKMGHLIGLDLSRAWMLAGIVSALPLPDPRRYYLSALANTLEQSGLRRIDREKYHGAHWLGTFAVYLLTQRGLPDSPPAIG